MKITRDFLCLFFLIHGLTFGISAGAIEDKCETKLAPALSARISEERLREMIDYLTGERSIAAGLRLNGRSSDSAREATRWSLLRHLESLGFRPEFEAFPGGANIVVEIPGTANPQDVLEMGAHFDSIETGADDNAAGVAVLVHLAELFKETPPRKTLRLVFHDLEEKNGEGARHHALQLAHDPRHLLGVLLIDAIGYYPPNLQPEVLTVETGHRADNYPLAQLIEKWGARQPVELSFENGHVPNNMADHGSYWSHGRPAILLSRPFGDSFNSPHNHTRRDTANNMNWPYYMNAARMIVTVVDGVVNQSEFANDNQRSWNQPASILGTVKKEETPAPATSDQSHDPFNRDSYVYWDSDPSPQDDEVNFDRHEGYIAGLKSAMEAAKVPSKSAPRKVRAEVSQDLSPKNKFAARELDHDYHHADPFIREILDAHERTFPGAIRYGHINYYTPLKRLGRVQKALLDEFAKNPELSAKWDEREPMTDFTVTVNSTSRKQNILLLDQYAWDRMRNRWSDKVSQHIGSWNTPEQIVDRLKRLSVEVYRDRNRFLFASSDTDFMRAFALYLLSANLLKSHTTRDSLEQALENLEAGALDYLKDSKAYGPLLQGLEVENPEDWVKKTYDWILESIYKQSTSVALVEGQQLSVREVPPEIAIFRGYVGNDCSTSFSPGFPFTPADRYYYIFDKSNRSLGYVGISLVEIENKKAVFVHTIQGPDLTAENTEMILRAFAELSKPVFGAEMAVLGPDRSIDNNVNYFPISRTMIATVAGKPTMPMRFWDHGIRNIIVKNDSIFEYDNPTKNDLARQIEYPDPEITTVEISQRPFENKFKSP